MSFNFLEVFGYEQPEILKFEWASICSFVNDPSRPHAGPFEHERFTDAIRHAYGFSIEASGNPTSQIRELRDQITALSKKDRSAKRKAFWAHIDGQPPAAPDESALRTLCGELLAKFNLNHLKLNPFEMTSILLERYYHSIWRPRRDGESFEAYCRGYFMKIGRLRAGAVQKKPSRRRYRKPVPIAGAC